MFAKNIIFYNDKWRKCLLYCHQDPWWMGICNKRKRLLNNRCVDTSFVSLLVMSGGDQTVWHKFCMRHNSFVAFTTSNNCTVYLGLCWETDYFALNVLIFWHSMWYSQKENMSIQIYLSLFVVATILFMILNHRTCSVTIQCLLVNWMCQASDTIETLVLVRKGLQFTLLVARRVTFCLFIPNFWKGGG